MNRALGVCLIDVSRDEAVFSGSLAAEELEVDVLTGAVVLWDSAGTDVVWEAGAVGLKRLKLAGFFRIGMMVGRMVAFPSLLSILVSFWSGSISLFES